MSDKKNVVFWVAVQSPDSLLQQKHANFEYFEYSKRTWQYWCKKNNAIFFEYTNTDYDTSIHRVTWTRWFDVFKQLDEAKIDYDKVLLTDASIMIRWDTPNIFDLCNNDITAFRSLENVRWLYECMEGYNDLFNGFKYDLRKYINCGFQIINSNHKPFLDNLKKFYFDNLDTILQLQQTVKRGTDQPVYNYLLQINDIKVDTSLSPAFFIMHLTRFNWLQYNWQLKEDMTPYFIKYGYIWAFSGFDRTQRKPLMEQTWEIIKNNYNS